MGIQDTFKGGYSILLQVDIGFFYGVLLQGDTGYFFQGHTGYLYRVIQDALSGGYRILLRGIQDTFTRRFRILTNLRPDIDFSLHSRNQPPHPHTSLFLIISPLKGLQFYSKEVFAYLVNTILTISTS